MSSNTKAGLERSCAADRIDALSGADGFEGIEATFAGEAFAPHRHNTYAIGTTLHGVQRFQYRGVKRASLPGQVIVLHPDEVHDGEAGTEAGFHYRMIYIRPSLISEALAGRSRSLPFVAETILDDAPLRDAVQATFADRDEHAPIADDEIVTALADALLRHDQSAERGSRTAADLPALERVRAFLDAECTRTVRSEELEALAGHSRFSLARQFRSVTGTSLYRYSIMRRLDRARSMLAANHPCVEVAIACGFADQAHFTRHFKAAYGLPPGRWVQLSRAAQD